MDIRSYFETQYLAFENYGVLLSQPELELILSANLEFSEEEKAFIAQSQQSLDNYLQLQMQTLAEAEMARDVAQELQKSAEANEKKLAELNQKLAAKQEITEAELEKERDFRLQQSKTSLQAQLTSYIVMLVALVVILPFLTQIFFPISDALISSVFNLALILCGALTSIIGALFQSKKEQE